MADHMMADRSTQTSRVVGLRTCCCAVLGIDRGRETFTGANLSENSLISGEEGSAVGFLRSVCEMSQNCPVQPG